MGKDALDKLIVDEENTDSSLLASLITGFVRFTNNGEIILERKFFKQHEWKKIMLYLLARKAVYSKKLKKEFVEEIKPLEISNSIGVPPKSITRCFSTKLKGITKAKAGAHKIPNYNLYRCEEVLNKNGK